jgi:predicted ATPase
MKLISFRASKVHGHLDFDVEFRPDVNFFAGLNGSGKTTALKLIVAMITPSISILREMKFLYSEVILENKEENIHISYERIKNKIQVTLIDNLGLSSSEILTMDDDSDILNKIKSITSPLFLSLDRRFIKTSQKSSRTDLFDFESYFSDQEDRSGRERKNADTSVNEILELVLEEFKKSRGLQTQAESKLRDAIIFDSLSFSEAAFDAKLPNKDAVKKLRTKQKAIVETLENLDISIEGFENKFDEFFKKFEKLIEGIKKNESFEDSINKEQQDALVTWFINQSQLKRIDRIFLMVEDYQALKARINRNLDKFISIINGFFIETGKSIFIDSIGELKVIISGRVESLSVLSSGERQILIMFTHLVLDKSLRNGVFIVDEPELSLHISWQEMFVPSVEKANSSLQLILATHSPAIIGGRNDMYVPLNGGGK